MLSKLLSLQEAMERRAEERERRWIAFEEKMAEKRFQSEQQHREKMFAMMETFMSHVGRLIPSPAGQPTPPPPVYVLATPTTTTVTAHSQQQKTHPLPLQQPHPLAAEANSSQQAGPSGPRAATPTSASQ